MRVTHTTVYLYANLIPTTADATDPSPNLRCISCGKLLARANGRILTVSNSQAGGALTEVPPNIPAVEIKCPNCNRVMSVIWQAL